MGQQAIQGTAAILQPCSAWTTTHPTVVHPEGGAFSRLGTGDEPIHDPDLALTVSGPVSSPGRVNILSVASQHRSGDCIIASILFLNIYLFGRTGSLFQNL